MSTNAHIIISADLLIKFEILFLIHFNIKRDTILQEKNTVKSAKIQLPRTSHSPFSITFQLDIKLKLLVIF